MALFPGPRWTPDEIAEGLMRHGFEGWAVRMMGAIVQAESLGYVWAHGLNSSEKSGAAFLAEGHGLIQMDDYWIPKAWPNPAVGLMDFTPIVMTAGDELMIPFYRGEKSFSQLAKDPEWNLAMAYEVFLLNALTRGWARAYEGWTSWKNNKHVPFLPEATAAARRAGAIT